MFRSIMIALAVFAGIGRSAPAADHTKDTPDTVKKALAEKKAILLDVREQNEWNEGHLKDARFVPLSKLRKEADLELLLKELPRDKPIYAHCKAGGRCLQAAEILQKKGFDVRPLKQGYQDLLEAGFEKAK